jgi:hypothetical protein
MQTSFPSVLGVTMDALSMQKQLDDADKENGSDEDGNGFDDEDDFEQFVDVADDEDAVEDGAAFEDDDDDTAGGLCTPTLSRIACTAHTCHTLFTSQLLFIHSFIHHLFIHSLTHSFIHSFTLSLEASCWRCKNSCAKAAGRPFLEAHSAWKRQSNSVR